MGTPVEAILGTEVVKNPIEPSEFADAGAPIRCAPCPQSNALPHTGKLIFIS
jgi:hypothetical protein